MQNILNSIDITMSVQIFIAILIFVKSDWSLYQCLQGNVIIVALVTAIMLKSFIAGCRIPSYQRDPCEIENIGNF